MIQGAAAAGPILTERYRPLDAVLRSGKVGSFEAVSDYAACLMPLLEALGWRGSLRHLVEAMPHFANTLDLVGVRNVLAALNYQSRSAKITLPEIDPRLLPCLFVPRRGSPIVVLEKTSSGIRIFDSGLGGERLLTDQRLSGTAYVVDRAGAEELAKTAARGDWVETLARRFKPLFLRMLGITFALNLLALVVPLFVMNVYDKVIGNASLNLLQLLLAGRRVGAFVRPRPADRTRPRSGLRGSAGDLSRRCSDFSSDLVFTCRLYGDGANRKSGGAY